MPPQGNEFFSTKYPCDPMNHPVIGHRIRISCVGPGRMVESMLEQNDVVETMKGLRWNPVVRS